MLTNPPKSSVRWPLITVPVSQVQNWLRGFNSHEITQLRSISPFPFLTGRHTYGLFTLPVLRVRTQFQVSPTLQLPQGRDVSYISASSDVPGAELATQQLLHLLHLNQTLPSHLCCGSSRTFMRGPGRCH